MKRLINADTVVRWEAYDNAYESFTRHSGTIAEFLDQMTDEGCPETVDAVPVRCKDCKYNSNPPEYGNAVCVLFYGMTDQMGFCHHGERREQA